MRLCSPCGGCSDPADLEDHGGYSGQQPGRIHHGPLPLAPQSVVGSSRGRQPLKDPGAGPGCRPWRRRGRAAGAAGAGAAEPEPVQELAGHRHPDPPVLGCIGYFCSTRISISCGLDAKALPAAAAVGCVRILELETPADERIRVVEPAKGLGTTRQQAPRGQLAENIRTSCRRGTGGTWGRSQGGSHPHRS